MNETTKHTHIIYNIDNSRSDGYLGWKKEHYLEPQYIRNNGNNIVYRIRYFVGVIRFTYRKFMDTK